MGERHNLQSTRRVCAGKYRVLEKMAVAVPPRRPTFITGVGGGGARGTPVAGGDRWWQGTRVGSRWPETRHEEQRVETVV